MGKPRYQVLPAGILVNTDGLGLHFRRKRQARSVCYHLNKRHPLAGYAVLDLREQGQ